MVTWTNITVKLGELKPWADNPRCSSKAQAKRLLKSFDEFGQVQTVAVGPGLEVYDGHQRLTMLLTVHGAEYKIDARQASEALADEDRRKLVAMLHAGAVGSWDWAQLSGWSAPELIDWGFDLETLREWNNDACNLREMLNSETELVDHKDEWNGMPEFEQKDLMGVQDIIVHFETRDDVNDFSELIKQNITDKTRSIWYPKQERVDFTQLVAHEQS